MAKSKRPMAAPVFAVEAGEAESGAFNSLMGEFYTNLPLPPTIGCKLLVTRDNVGLEASSACT
jgi:hypothetical protein